MSWEEKPLSPSAIVYNEYLARCAKDLAANEWTPPAGKECSAGLDLSKATDLSALALVFPDGKAPRAPGLTKKDLDRALSRLSVTMGKAVRQLVVEPLQKKIAELEQKQLHMAGTYKAGQRYRQNGLVSFQGGLWLCLADTDTRPGSGSPAWRLAVKRGDAK